MIPANRTILIRTDASPRIGLGHLSRCLALAHACRDRGAEVVFALRCRRSAGVTRAEGFETRVLGSTDSVARRVSDIEALELRLFAEELGSGWVVVDHHDVDDAYLETLTERGLRLLLLDDACTRRGSAARLIVNPSLGVDPREYDAGPGCEVLTGPRYAPLRSVFTQHRPEALAGRTGGLRRVLVVLGGADVGNRTRPLIEALDHRLPPGVEIRAVVGPLAELDGIVPERASSRVEVIGPLDARQLVNEMLGSQLAVTTASTVCWEMATLGLPVAILVTADNQEPSARELEARGLAPAAHSPAELVDAICADGGLLHDETRLEASRALARLTDGSGATAIAGRLAPRRAAVAV